MKVHGRVQAAARPDLPVLSTAADAEHAGRGSSLPNRPTWIGPEVTQGHQRGPIKSYLALMRAIRVYSLQSVM